MAQTFKLKAVGKIVSPIKVTKDLPLQGVNAEAHIFPEYSEALEGIEEHSHIILLSWLHQADRTLLKVHPRRIAVLPKKGVFALRSPVRPNPIALSPTKLLKRKGNILYLENVDLIDGTPILDIKPYSVGWDCIFSAKNNSTYKVYSKMPPEEAITDMLRQATNFHGDRCVGVSLGVRAAYLGMNYFKSNLQDKEIKVTAKVRGCIADALQALCSAGNKRFIRQEPIKAGEIIFEKDKDFLKLEITKTKFNEVEEVLSATDEEIFSLISCSDSLKRSAFK